MELDQAAHAIHVAGAPRPVLFRPPYGSFDSAAPDLARATEMLMVLWTVDTRDYARPGMQRIISLATTGPRPGAIVPDSVLHTRDDAQAPRAARPAA